MKSGRVVSEIEVVGMEMGGQLVYNWGVVSIKSGSR